MHSLIKYDSAKWVIALGFSSLLSLTSSITFFALSQMDDNIESMAELVDITNAKIIHAQSMRESVRLRGETLTNMFLINDLSAKQRARKELSMHGLNFVNSLARLEGYALGSAEQKMLSQMKPLLTLSERITNQAAELMLSDLTSDELKEALIDSGVARLKVFDLLNQLIDYQNKYSKIMLEDNFSYHETTRSIIILLAAASFLFGILISIIVIRQTSRKNYEIQYQAAHDSLTQLINRKEFERRLNYAIEKAAKDNSEHCMCFMDLDQFKIINDTCGHKAGDQLLIEITQLLTKNIRENDTLGRLGGDEFGLLMENCALDKAVEIAEGMIRLVRNYDFVWNNRIFHIGVSIGLVDITSKSEDVTSTMSEADVACYIAKDMGKNRLYIHELDDEHIKKVHKELSWVSNIEESLKNNRFVLYTQPIVAIDNKVGSRELYEVLLRLKDDDGQVLSPGEYIPAAERFGMMRAVDIWVITESIKAIETMNNSGLTEIPLMFVNLSANSITDKTFCNEVLQLLKDHKIPDESICFEITETAAIKNIHQAIDFMEQLKKAHCMFALDDFGTGMSSFTYLKNMPVDYLKIDGSFVNKMDVNTIDQAMVASINQIGQVMGMHTIAEHVENEAIMESLKEIGVTYGQGYHIREPFPLDEIPALNQNELIRHQVNR